MTLQRVRDYELVMILSPEATEAEAGATVKSISDAIVDGGGRISQQDNWGVKRLAYPIQRFIEGNYFVTRCTMEAQAAVALNETLNSAQDVLRHLVIKLEKSEIAAMEAQAERERLAKEQAEARARAELEAREREEARRAAEAEMREQEGESSESESEDESVPSDEPVAAAPEAEAPEPVAAEAPSAEAESSEPVAAEASAAEAEAPEPVTAEVSEPEAEAPEPVAAEVTEPEAESSEPAVAEVSTPEAEAPEPLTAESSVAEAESSEPVAAEPSAEPAGSEADASPDSEKSKEGRVANTLTGVLSRDPQQNADHRLSGQRSGDALHAQWRRRYQLFSRCRSSLHNPRWPGSRRNLNGSMYPPGGAWLRRPTSI